MYARLPDKMEAASYYQSAISVGQDVEAMNCLGLMYESGLGLDRMVVDPSPSHPKRTVSGSGMAQISAKTSAQRRLSSSREKDDKDFIDDDRYATHPHRAFLMAQNKYLSALKIEPNYTDALFNLGNLKYRLSSSVNLQSDSDS